MRTQVRSLASLSGLRIWHCCELWGHRHGLDPALPWLWCRLAAVALIKTPSLGTSICHECGPKKTTTNKKGLYQGNKCIEKVMAGI